MRTSNTLRFSSIALSCHLPTRPGAYPHLLIVERQQRLTLQFPATQSDHCRADWTAHRLPQTTQTIPHQPRLEQSHHHHPPQRKYVSCSARVFGACSLMRLWHSFPRARWRTCCPSCTEYRRIYSTNRHKQLRFGPGGLSPTRTIGRTCVADPLVSHTRNKTTTLKSCAA